MTHEPDPEIMDALHINELLRDLETEMELDRLQAEKEQLQARLREAEIAAHIEEGEKLEAAGFAPVSVIGMDSLIYERDGAFYSRPAALKEARF